MVENPNMNWWEANHLAVNFTSVTADLNLVLLKTNPARVQGRT